jgi:hypothetical protein
LRDAQTSSSSRATSVMNDSEIGPSLTAIVAFQCRSSTVSSSFARHTRDDARHVHQQRPRLLGRRRNLERVLELHATGAASNFLRQCALQK